MVEIKCVNSILNKLYPLNWLTSQLNNKSFNIELRGVFLRLINYIYIDESPHKFLKMERVFKAYESSQQNIKQVNYQHSDEFKQENLADLVLYIKNYIHLFLLAETKINSITSFDLELIRHDSLFIVHETK